MCDVLSPEFLNIAKGDNAHIGSWADDAEDCVCYCGENKIWLLIIND